MKFHTNGLIIREMNIGEHDRLIYALTGGHGVIKAFVKGANNIKNPKCAATSLLAYSRLTVYKSRDTYTVGEAKTQHMFSRLRYDVRKMCLAQYFCELGLVICPKEQSSEEFLRLMLNALYLLDEGKKDDDLIKACLEMRLASMAGYMPDLRMCSVCGEYTSERMCFLPRTGKLECASCRVNASEPSVTLSEAALTALRHTVYADDNKLFAFSLSESGLEALNRASESYLRYRFERDFSTLDFYKMMKQ